MNRPQYLESRGMAYASNSAPPETMATISSRSSRVTCSSASSENTHSLPACASARFFCGPKPGQFVVSTTRAPYARAISTVRSLLCESTTTISSAQETEERQRSMFASSFLVMTMTEIFIAFPLTSTLFETASNTRDGALDPAAQLAELEDFHRVQILVPVGLHAYSQIIAGDGSLVLADFPVQVILLLVVVAAENRFDRKQRDAPERKQGLPIPSQFAGVKIDRVDDAQPFRHQKFLVEIAPDAAAPRRRRRAELEAAPIAPENAHDFCAFTLPVARNSCHPA